jgi:nuclear mRNA export protein SAC3
MRDRLRAIRQDFRIMRESSPIAIDCHERIAKFQIMAVHALRGTGVLVDKQETDMLADSEQSFYQNYCLVLILFTIAFNILIGFYNDARNNLPSEERNQLVSPNEAEFRAYSLLVHIRGPEFIHSIATLPSAILNHPKMKLAIKLFNFYQTSNAPKERKQKLNVTSEAATNGFSRFFKFIREDRYGVDFVMACLLEERFWDVRRAGLKAYGSSMVANYADLTVKEAIKLLGFHDREECLEGLERFGIEVKAESQWDAAGDVNETLILSKNVRIDGEFFLSFGLI